MPCYAPNGTEITTTDFQPCNGIQGEFSMCCATNRTSPAPDICLSNGLCKWVNDGVDLYYRNSCSDPSWKSPHCLNICKSASDEDYKGDAQLSQCSDGSWCCGNDATNSCCESNNTFALAATVGASTSTTSSRSATSSIPSSTASTSHSATVSTTPPPSNNSQGLSTGARAGVGVGVALGAVALLAGVAFLWLRRRRRSQTGQETKNELSADSVPRAEMDPQPTIVEISGPDSLPKKPPKGVADEPVIRHEMA